MNPFFFQQIEKSLAEERLDAYRQQDGASPVLALARYLWNMALCEALYSPLQITEVALRNAIHAALSNRVSAPDWYKTLPDLLGWQQEQIQEVLRKLVAANKADTPGSVVAELTFGFWTGFLNHQHARTGIGYYLSHQVFRHAPVRRQNLSELDDRLGKIRALRNRVFHHERIIHWRDLDSQHAALLELIGWISPELCEMAWALDRYTSVRRAGIAPWVAKLRQHWPDPSTPPTDKAATSVIVPVSEILDASSGADTPFGERWGGDVFTLNDHHLDTLMAKQILALDVQNEYVIYLKHGL
jgi:hypothetical protein